MSKLSNEALERAAAEEKSRLADLQRKVVDQYLQQRVTELSALNRAYRELLEEHAPEALEEFDAEDDPPSPE